MKKLMTFLTVCLIVNVSFAQNVFKSGTVEVQNFKDAKSAEIIKIQAEKTNFEVKDIYSETSKTTTKGAVSRWYDYGASMIQFWGSESNAQNYFSFNTLFPDTLVHYTDTSNTRPWMHSVVNSFDMRSPMLNDANYFAGKMNYTSGSTYKIDSIGIFGMYKRNIEDADIVDTLFFDVVTSFTPSTGVQGYYYFTEFSSFFGVDTVWYNYFAYDKVNDKIGLQTKRCTLLLTENSVNDLIPNDDRFLYKWSNVNYFSVNVDHTITSSVPYIVTAVTFKPGYTYEENDALSQKNYFSFGALKEKPSYGFPVSYEKKIYNESHVLRTYDKYHNGDDKNLYTNVTYGAIIKNTQTNVYETFFWFDHIWMDYKITCSNCGFVGVQEQDAKNVSVYPNPANNTVTVQLANAAPAKVEIINLVGQTVISQNASTEEVKMDVSNINRGVYMVRIAQEGKVYTSKLVVR